MPIILMCLTTSRLFGLQKQSPRRDPLCKAQDHPFPQVKRQGTRSGATLSYAPGDLSCRNFQQLGKWIHFDYHDQEPGPSFPFQLVFSSILPPPCPPPRPFTAMVALMFRSADQSLPTTTATR